ncbi:MAG: phage terminase large subunit family protein [Agathobacter sp.]|nr:phage terminase large subunit family protein [Agathobacter sp.]
MNNSDVPFKTFRIFQRVAKTMEPPPQLSISEWADQYRVLSKGLSAEAGKWNTNRLPYQKEIMDSMSDMNVSKTVVMSSSQVGKTEIILNVIGYYIAEDPSTILVVQPNKKPMAEDFSKHRFSYMIRDTPALNGKVSDKKSGDGDNTVFSKDFPGGFIAFAGANAAADLAGRPVRVVLMDEVDRYPASAGEEGDPVDLAVTRTTTFWNNRILMVSSPTTTGASKIYDSFMDGTQEEWEYRCPACGKYQPYDFHQLDFKTMKMKCIHCGWHLSRSEIYEQPHKWVAMNPGSSVRSFHLNALASPFTSWEKMVEQFKKANKAFKEKHDISKLKVFINTKLGLPFDDTEYQASGKRSVDEEVLLARREEYDAELPDGVLLLTGSADVQGDRLEYEIRGWGKDNESWGIQKGIIWENPGLDAAWKSLVEIMSQTFHFRNGCGLNVAGTCVDTGGDHTNRVYQFIRDMQKIGKKFYGIKGYADTPGIPLIYKKTKVEIKNDRGAVVDTTHIYILGVDSGKDDIQTWIEVTEPGPCYCHFPLDKDAGYDRMYFRGLLSEVKVEEFKRNGGIRTRWKKKQGVQRNEPLDLFNYNHAAKELINPNFDVLEKKLSQGINYMQKTPEGRKNRQYGQIKRGVEI